MRLAVTLGDPRGIGPEVVAKALRAPGVDAAGGEGTDPVYGSANPKVVRVVGPVECGGDFAGSCRFEAVGGGAAGLGPGEAAGRWRAKWTPS